MAAAIAPVPRQSYGVSTYPSDCTSITAVADNYFANFLFGTSSAYALANYFEAHLRQNLDSVYAQDDWKVRPNLTLNLGLRWEYGSPYSEQNNYVSNWDPGSQTVFTINPKVTAAGGGITPITGSGAYGKTLVNPDLTDFAPRIGFAFAPTPKLSIRGGFGTSYVHYTRAGSGDIAAINAPQAQFAAVPRARPPRPITAQPRQPPAPDHHNGNYNSICYATADRVSRRTCNQLQLRHRQHHLGTEEYAR